MIPTTGPIKQGGCINANPISRDSVPCPSGTSNLPHGAVRMGCLPVYIGSESVAVWSADSMAGASLVGLAAGGDAVLVAWIEGRVRDQGLGSCRVVRELDGMEG